MNIDTLARSIMVALPDAQLAQAARTLPDDVLAGMLREQMATTTQRPTAAPQPTAALRLETKPGPLPVQTEKLRASIISELDARRDGLSFMAIVNATKSSKGTVHKALERLVAAGKLTRQGKGAGSIWRLA
jgi:hypothetical protein